MHIVMVGVHARPALTLIDSGHEVTVLYEPPDRDRMAGLEARVTRSSQVASYADVPDLLGVLERIGATAAGVDAVVTLKEFAVVPAALLGAVLGARALAPDVAARCRDKALQKAAWRAAGIGTARCVLVEAGAAGPGDGAVVEAVLAGGLQGPYIVKPPASAGVAGVREADDEDALVAAVLDIVRERPGTRRLLVEERIDGDEWHFDGLIRGGRIDPRGLLVSRYLQPSIRTRYGCPLASVSFHPASEPDLYREAADLATRASTALGLTDGVFHFECFGAPGRFVAGELAARPGGGLVPRAVQAAVGWDPRMAAIQAVTGEAVEFGAVSPDVVGWIDLPSDAGWANRVQESAVRAEPAVIDAAMYVPVGAPMAEMRVSSAHAVGAAVVRAPERAGCATALRGLCRTVRRINGSGRCPCAS